MSISRRIARPLLASMFISGGLDAIQSPEGKVKAAEAVTEPLKARFPILPEDTATLIRLNGMVQVGAGSLLAVGKFRRLASWALVASVIPTTYAGHRFWEEVDDDVRAQQRIHFLKNLGLLGGLILAANDTEGAPSLGWKARRRAGQVTTAIGAGRAASGARAHHTTETVAEVSRRAKKRADAAAGKGRRAGRQANKAAVRASHQATIAAHRAGHEANLAAHRAGHQANVVAHRAGHKANRKVSDAAKSGVTFASPYVRHANETAAGAARVALENAGPLVSAGVERAGEIIAKASEHLPN
jgi:putative oxidoreductase